MSKHELWKIQKKWKSSPEPFKRRGVGIASVMQACGYGPVVPDYANAKVELTIEGNLRVYCGVVDMGQGNASTNLQIVSAILGQESHRIELVQPDTDLTLPSGSASASRCTFTFGNALVGAAQILKDRILQKAADLTMSELKGTIVLVPGGVRNVLTGQEMSLSRIARLLNASERVAVHHFRAPIASDKVTSDEALRLHGMPHIIFSYGVHLAFIELDELTGSVNVRKYLSITDAGKVINGQAYHQQIHGAIAQGLGFALLEDLKVRDGQILTTNYATYLIPTAMDIPEIESVAVEIFEPAGPFGLKGAGEISINGPLPAIANALADACGIRLTKSPFTAQRIQAALSHKLHDGGSV
jgi:CO/xanthine dehydrogenase Mo-binding subunit